MESFPVLSEAMSFEDGSLILPDHFIAVRWQSALLFLRVNIHLLFRFQFGCWSAEMMAKTELSIAFPRFCHHSIRISFSLDPDRRLLLPTNAFR
jgi:hypothetical protein